MSGITLDQLKETFEASVAPMRDQIKEDVTKQIDEKVKEILNQHQPEKPQIEIGDEPIEKDPKGGFRTLSHFACSVAKAQRAMAGMGKLPVEIKAWQEYVSKAASSTSMEEEEGQYGGYLIPPEFKNELWMAVEQKNEILPRCTNVPMARTTVNIPFVNGFDESSGEVYGGIVWYWVDELETKTETRPKMGRITLSLKKVAGLAFSSDELIEDSPISMENVLKNGFRDGLNYQINYVLLRGTGAGQPMGIINAPCKVSVTKETGQVADTILWENIVKMYARMFDSSNAVWMANQNTLPQLASMSLAVGTGGVPVFLPANGASGKPYDTLFGKPLIWNKHCSTLGDEGDIIFVDWSQYLVGQKAGQGSTGKFDTSIHLKFDADQTAFRFVFRIDGQPWWPSALTPPQATGDTLSPIVTLAERA